MVAATTTEKFAPATLSAGEIAKLLRKESALSTDFVVRLHFGGSADLEIHRRPFGGTRSFSVHPVQARVVDFRAYRPERGCWVGHGIESLLAIVEGLPSAASVTFEVATDAHTNQYMEAAGLHGDVLYLVAKFERRGKPVRQRFLLDTSTTPHNSARFGLAG
jgi:hypothetical protein